MAKDEATRMLEKVSPAALAMMLKEIDEQGIEPPSPARALLTPAARRGVRRRCL